MKKKLLRDKSPLMYDDIQFQLSGMITCFGRKILKSTTEVNEPSNIICARTIVHTMECISTYSDGELDDLMVSLYDTYSDESISSFAKTVSIILKLYKDKWI